MVALLNRARHAARDASPPHEPACPLCGHTPCEPRGPILHPDPTFVAGVAIDLARQDFHLWRCTACAFQFKHPRVDESAVIECYRRAAAGHWDVRPDPRRRRFDAVRRMVERHTPPPAAGHPRRVLDVGCGNGALLQEFGPEWEVEGIEPSDEAARLAQERGITIVGPTLDDSTPRARWDVVLAIDVAEHIPSPVPFFRRIATALRPGGIHVLLTGDTDALSWRWQGSRYWYCSLVEHESFYCREALEHIAVRCGLTLVEYERMSHIRTGVLQRLTETSKNVAFSLVQSIGWLPGRRLRERVLDRRAPGWVSARDHLLCVMRRSA